MPLQSRLPVRSPNLCQPVHALVAPLERPGPVRVIGLALEAVGGREEERKQRDVKGVQEQERQDLDGKDGWRGLLQLVGLERVADEGRQAEQDTNAGLQRGSGACRREVGRRLGRAGGPRLFPTVIIQKTTSQNMKPCSRITCWSCDRLNHPYSLRGPRKRGEGRSAPRSRWGGCLLPRRTCGCS